MSWDCFSNDFTYFCIKWGMQHQGNYKHHPNPEHAINRPENILTNTFGYWSTNYKNKCEHMLNRRRQIISWRSKTSHLTFFPQRAPNPTTNRMKSRMGLFLVAKPGYLSPWPMSARATNLKSRISLTDNGHFFCLNRSPTRANLAP